MKSLTIYTPAVLVPNGSQVSMSTYVARSQAELASALAESRQDFEVHRVPSAETDEWGLVDGALQHRSRGFFSLNGVRNSHGETFALLYQPQGAVTGLLAARIDGEYCFLLQGRAEPGCLGEAQFGPTVQSTPANFMRLHGGAPTPYMEMFIAHDPTLTLLDNTSQLDLGARYIHKRKTSILSETVQAEPTQKPFVWATAAAVATSVTQNAFFNLDLRSILSIATWYDADGAEAFAPLTDEIRRSLHAPVRPKVLATIFAKLAVNRTQPAIIPLQSLWNWRQTEWGWSERTPQQGFSVDFYRVTAPLRERASWVQPLVNSASDGHVVLACRERGGVMEFLVRVSHELGLASSAAIAPTYVKYPGANDPSPAWLDGLPPWSSTTESDEGGRFYRDSSKYEVVRVDDIANMPDEDGVWITLPELKFLLGKSDTCTIQLRGVTSQLLGPLGNCRTET